MSDVGILLHQISAHLQAQSTLSLALSENIESPSLSFEQFLVFLCSYSLLFFDRSIDSPTRDSSTSYKNQNTSTDNGINAFPLLNASIPLSINSQSATNSSLVNQQNETKRKGPNHKNVLGGSAGLNIIINQSNQFLT
jgi:hypothetical protein